MKFTRQLVEHARDLDDDAWNRILTAYPEAPEDPEGTPALLRCYLQHWVDYHRGKGCLRVIASPTLRLSGTLRHALGGTPMGRAILSVFDNESRAPVG